MKITIDRYVTTNSDDKVILTETGWKQAEALASAMEAANVDADNESAIYATLFEWARDVGLVGDKRNEQLPDEVMFLVNIAKGIFLGDITPKKKIEVAAL